MLDADLGVRAAALQSLGQVTDGAFATCLIAHEALDHQLLGRCGPAQELLLHRHGSMGWNSPMGIQHSHSRSACIGRW